MGIGSLIVLGTVRNRLKKMRDDSLLSTAKLHFPLIMEDILRDSLPRIINNEKDPEKKEVYIRMYKEINSWKSILATLFYSLLITPDSLKYVIISMIHDNAIRGGIYLIILGIILSVIGIWI